ncbi:putative bacteriocin export ABC transporter [Sinanaerobacter sp. ZZT-01]|uniref:ABC transporter ATP-binding protein n=1 Tax=Sinanaerobacter sp. ZZT-01 TaxID=3111540 RepID=UPI002D774D25|nr:putative bacteriocin export ABC transporter [Sinanaerobacter sp. ZZT-01]WRR94975.1 putative bacteriocin export ABC transporter [Sinanaerobacter sp. ZZT-01]
MQPLIETRNLNKNFGEKSVLSNFTFSADPQEFISITGKSGSGKSTLLNILGLLDQYDSGELLIHNEVISNISGKKALLLRRNYMGYIFQNYALIEDETVEENLKVALRYAPENGQSKKDIIQGALAEVGLENFERKKIYELSGGEQQRVAVARVFIKPCELILADEPTGSLDLENKNLILKLFRKLRENGKTIIIVTHDLEIPKICDKNITL